MRYFILLPLLFCLSLSLKSQNSSLYFPPKTGNTWQTINPTSLGFCPERVDSLYQFLEQNNTKSFILLQDGKIVLEKYFGTYTQDSFWYWASAGKSLTAFLIGQAQDEGLLQISDKTSKYLGDGWTSCPPAKEDLITIRHQLSMSNGLDDNLPPTPAIPDPDNCLDPECLVYKADAGTRWAYHNAPYHLLHEVIEAASGQNINTFTKTRVLDKVGMRGLWIDHIQYGRARDMARFGLLALAKGIWNGDTLLRNQAYFFDMTHRSQELNKSYGYLWWLNGQPSYMLPGLQFVVPGKICPNAPDDMYAALGKNDQKIHIVPSKGWVIVRQGNPSSVPGGQVPVVFDNLLWAKLNTLVCSPTTTISPDQTVDFDVFPNPAAESWNLRAESGIGQVRLTDMYGKTVYSIDAGQATTINIPAAQCPAGMYYLQVELEGKWLLKTVFVAP